MRPRSGSFRGSPLYELGRLSLLRREQDAGRCVEPHLLEEIREALHQGFRIVAIAWIWLAALFDVLPIEDSGRIPKDVQIAIAFIIPSALREAVKAGCRFIAEDGLHLIERSPLDRGIRPGNFHLDIGQIPKGVEDRHEATLFLDSLHVFEIGQIDHEGASFTA